MNWPQARAPFGEEAAGFVEALDPEQDLRTLQENGVVLRAENRRVFRVCNLFLRLGVAGGLTAEQLGLAFCRQTRAKSVLERMSNRALQLTAAERAGHTLVRMNSRELWRELEDEDEGTYLDHLGQVIRDYVQQLASSGEPGA